jgi:hypothetical protein
MKKLFVLFLVVLVLGFAACQKKPVKKIGEAVTIDDNTPIKELWRGVVTGNVKTFGPWGIIEVASPADDQDHRFEMCVILREGEPARDLISRNIKVGTEIYFSKHWVYSSNILTESHPRGCDLGLFYSTADMVWVSKDINIINPPKH